MSRQSILSLIVFVIGVIYFGCNDVQFAQDPDSFYPCQNFNKDCTPIEGIDYFSYSFDVGFPQVDIIFVDDNSGSMSTEQKQMGDHIGDFLNSLEGLDYHLGIITTDVTSTQNPARAFSADSNNNGIGALQDGNFLKFTNGEYFLTDKSTNLQVAFRQTIQRPETLVCETALANKKDIKTNCPSPDERGIFASILALSKLPAGFIREGAHLALVILSDEDERSASGTLTGYPLEDNDQPQTLVNKVHESLGNAKTFSAHAVVVKPGDSGCLTQQGSQSYGVRGYEGKIYSELVNLTSGVLGSVCEKNWSTQIGEIGSGIKLETSTLPIACSAPADGKIEVTLTPDSGIAWSFDSANRVIRFAEPLPAGTQVFLEYACPALKK